MNSTHTSNTDALATPTTTTQNPTPAFEITASRQFTPWLAEQHLSLVFTTYQAGKIFFIGVNPQTGQFSVFQRTFERCMGLCASGNSLYMSSLYQLWRFENSLEPGQIYNGYDALYVPQMSYITGDLDIHDVAISGDEEKKSSNGLVFVNTLFSCLATVSATHSFVPLWQPPFISKLAAEDRCHLNGLAMVEGQPKYVTSVSQSDVADGWRDKRRDGGCVVDIESNEIVVRGLSMPHSPRWHQGKLWLMNSGTGEFGTVDLQSGTFEPVAFCPGYGRGVAMWRDYAVVGLSKPRHNKTFQGLPLDENLATKQAEPRCGLAIIDLRSGDMVHSLRIEGIVEELYDVAILPQVRRPMAIGLKSDEIRRMVSIGTKE
ncbi:TIGR03032 family protein [Oscillatoriales cyanobacterium LEGE 11467]|uniref:TIGR03032 family protein n=1 Tax=Zarconia navalis LEGE 11467 TaxID=1828826 RepID=A0A928Z892_9CYAN|nr:TIGR03032 family protein [Zarconia navalis]MBE9042232.1 TIGR03032 family protein [Zarconia navalis LEGE 11467]